MNMLIRTSRTKWHYNYNYAYHAHAYRSSLHAPAFSAQWRWGIYRRRRWDAVRLRGIDAAEFWLNRLFRQPLYPFLYVTGAALLQLFIDDIVDEWTEFKRHQLTPMWNNFRGVKEVKDKDASTATTKLNQQQLLKSSSLTKVVQIDGGTDSENGTSGPSRTTSSTTSENDRDPGDDIYEKKLARLAASPPMKVMNDQSKKT
ncbi:unnamed protein product [Amoebophrya sp. A25]|nr:unnamed protein product [Amoebophrya sp. A25]|eukprot:GSA25T00023523001.1